MERDMRGILEDPFVKEAFTPSQKREIRERQGNHCGMCGGKPGKDKVLEVHHKIPESRGGTDDTENGIGLCANDHFIANRMFIEYGIDFNSLLNLINGKKTI